MTRNEIKNKINLKKHQIKKNKDQIQNKYKPKDTIEFVKALHVYQALGERKKEEEKNQSSQNHSSNDKTCHLKRCIATFSHRVSRKLIFFATVHAPHLSPE